MSGVFRTQHSSTLARELKLFWGESFSGTRDWQVQAGFLPVTESTGGVRDKLQQARLNSARRNAVEILEIAGEVRGLFVTEIIGDGLDLFAVFEAGIGKAQSHLTKKFTHRDVMMFDEVAFESAERNTASTCEEGRPEIGLLGERLPIGLRVGRTGGRGWDERLAQIGESDVRDEGFEGHRRMIQHHKISSKMEWSGEGRIAGECVKTPFSFGGRG